MEVALVVLDGWGLGDRNGGEGAAGAGAGRGRDAVAAADTPTFDRLAAAGAYGTLDVSGRRVGLPDGQMGNSEVGHLNLGAGRVVKQAYTRISDAVAAWRGEPVDDPDPEPFADNDAIARAFASAAESGGRVHLMGLTGAGGVHADQDHLHALIELAAERGVEAVTHAFTDGRDAPPRAAAERIAELEAAVADAGTGDVATVVGRYYAMDRDENWDRTRRAYDAVVEREAPHEAPSAVAAVEAAYERGETDEFVEPTLVSGGRPPEDGDSVVWFNFRADRARQFVRMLGDVDPEWPFGTDPPDVDLVTMTEYDRTFPFPVAFPPNEPTDTLGDVLADAGATQLRVAESEKYPHVTYFLNGGREVEFAGETRIIVESPDVPTYDLRPEMSATEVTDRTVDRIARDDPDVLVLNYANPDMVGHTGDFEAAVAAVEAVDRELGRLAAAVADAGGELLVTADHGNADDMGTPEDPHTAHTANPVPLVYAAPGDGTDRSGGHAVREGGSLCDVAPTLLALLGVDRPAAMTGQSLLRSR